MKTQEENTHLMESYSLAKYGSKKDIKIFANIIVKNFIGQYLCDFCGDFS